MVAQIGVGEPRVERCRSSSRYFEGSLDGGTILFNRM